MQLSGQLQAKTALPLVERAPVTYWIRIWIGEYIWSGTLEEKENDFY